MKKILRKTKADIIFLILKPQLLDFLRKVELSDRPYPRENRDFFMYTRVRS